MASSNTRPKRVGLAREHEHIGGGVDLASSSRSSTPEIVHLRKRARGCVRAPVPRPPPTSIPAGRVRGTPRRSSPPAHTSRRTGRSAASLLRPLARLRMKDVRRPRRATRASRCSKPFATRSSTTTCVGRHHHSTDRENAAATRSSIDAAAREARVHVFRKARVIRGGEREVVCASAKRRAAMPSGPCLVSDVQHVRIELANAIIAPALRKHRRGGFPDR